MYTFYESVYNQDEVFCPGPPTFLASSESGAHSELQPYLFTASLSECVFEREVWAALPGGHNVTGSRATFGY